MFGLDFFYYKKDFFCDFVYGKFHDFSSSGTRFEGEGVMSR